MPELERTRIFFKRKCLYQKKLCESGSSLRIDGASKWGTTSGSSWRNSEQILVMVWLTRDRNFEISTGDFKAGSKAYGFDEDDDVTVRMTRVSRWSTNWLPKCQSGSTNPPKVLIDYFEVNNDFSSVAQVKEEPNGDEQCQACTSGGD